MVMVFMLSRLRRTFALAALLVGSALVTTACQKVPLLAPSGSTITLTAANTALPTNGTTDIIAQVIEASGTPPHSGTRVTFTTNLGTIQPSEAETDIGGRVVVKFIAGSGSGTATITAISGGVSASGANAIKIAVGSAAVGRVSADANPGTLSSNGGNSTITAVVFDTNGNPLGGVPVSFTTDAGTVSPATVNSDGNGRAQSVLTTNKTAKVTATAGNQGSATGTGTGSTATTSSQQTATVTVTVNSSAGISIGAPTPASPTAGQTVTFPLTYSAATATPVARVVMDFGDGSAAQTFTGQPSAVSHTYSAAGSFLVRATATDTFGDVSTTTASVTVGVRPQPTVTISASPAAPAVGAVVTFTITPAVPTSSSATIQSISVDFGDGQNVTLGVSTGTTTVQHVYQTAGTYTATAIVRDSAGISGSGATTLVVGQRPQLAVTVTSSANPTPNTTTFTIAATASTGASINSITVDFGDGSRVTLQGNATSVAHVYAASGTYTVVVTATDSAGATGSASAVVIVGGGIVASFTISPSAAKVGQSVSFNGSDSTSPNTITSYTYDFGDGTPAVSGSSPSQTHVYTAAGSYTVRLTIQDSAGRTATKTNPLPVT